MNQEGSLEGNNGFYKMSKENPFANTFPDPLCKLNLKETSEFVKALPVANNNGQESRGFLEVSAQRRRDVDLVNSTVVTKRNNVEPPCTPGRPIFSFSTVGNNLTTRKQFPSKWDDAEKWLISGHDSPATHHHHNNNGLRLLSESKALVFAEKSRVTEEKVSKPISSFQEDHHNNLPRAFNGVSASATAADVLLKGNKPFPLNFYSSTFRFYLPQLYTLVFLLQMLLYVVDLVTVCLALWKHSSFLQKLKLLRSFNFFYLPIARTCFQNTFLGTF